MEWLETIILVMVVWFFAGVLIRISGNEDERRGLISL